ncbi:precorrin-6A synthase (deacetylating) [Plantactinospora sp. KLBMP9567]|uniref:precorrin-6A synthase (deacetylating) n=1 Tax=Plantactinospora sp. KLBMP9567 TaxID=3085900 RepID=UPI0029826219|nr:precorrin-6A synthase (deacetylating) [Plantactinospora sp. KLBMP9567]MDW5330603.1 precorrin-6A synthase (deacetylating) [Plantactinospora sp. KLBMP9567]
MRKILVIGIGAGDPDQLTLEAVRAIAEVDVFFVLDKGAAKQDLLGLRQEILRRHPTKPGHRVVELRDPDRDRTAPAYVDAVDEWRRRRAELLRVLVRDEVPADGCAAFLVWGDPALYDSTLGVIEEMLADGTVEFDYTVIPGVSSVSTLAARHRIGLNRVGRPFQVTTGRLLAQGWPPGVDDLVVMLDAHCTFTRVTEPDVEIYWGAYLGTADEILVAGPLAEAGPRIVEVRRAARERKGWIMDTYLLRRRTR